MEIWSGVCPGAGDIMSIDSGLSGSCSGRIKVIAGNQSSH